MEERDGAGLLKEGGIGGQAGEEEVVDLGVFWVFIYWAASRADTQ